MIALTLAATLSFTAPTHHALKGSPCAAALPGDTLTTPLTIIVYRRPLASRYWHPGCEADSAAWALVVGDQAPVQWRSQGFVQPGQRLSFALGAADSGYVYTAEARTAWSAPVGLTPCSVQVVVP